jgi:hypothetical protein
MGCVIDNSPNVECECPDSNVSVDFDQIKGVWRLTKRERYDSTGQNLVKLELFDDNHYKPCGSDSFKFRIFEADTNPEYRFIDKPIGGLLRCNPAFDTSLVSYISITYAIVHFMDGGNCIKTLTTNPNGGFKVCVLDYNPNFIKLRHKWTNFYFVYEAYRVQ